MKERRRKERKKKVGYKVASNERRLKNKYVAFVAINSNHATTTHPQPPFYIALFLKFLVYTLIDFRCQN